DRTPPVHRPQQPVLEHGPQRPNGEPAGRHLPVRSIALPGMAGARLDWSAHHHVHRTRPEYRGTRHCLIGKAVMNHAPQPSTAIPVVTHTVTDTEKFQDKVSIRNLSFYYGAHKALKDINISLYQGKVT